MSDRVRGLGWGPVAIMLVLCVVWGGNMAAIKIATRGLSPLFAAGVRSAVASLCLYAWMRWKGIPIFPRRDLIFHGAVVGIVFGVEFGCIFLGLGYTLASRGYVLLYTHPFWVALGAHFFLTGDRLTGQKVLGLVLAFVGVAVLFSGGGWGEVSLATLPGDLLLLFAGMLWASTTLYVKRFLTSRAVPVQTLFYQLAYSAPLLFILSAFLEERVYLGFSPEILAALAYQCLVVAFVSYLVWFELIHRHPVSYLAAFSFFTPVFGTLLSGVLLLSEPVTPSLVAALVLVSAGILVVNLSPRRA